MPIKTIQKLSILLILIIILFSIVSSNNYISASSGCCSHHGGVDCGAGADSDGSYICKDGWRDSSCSYIENCPKKSNSSQKDKSSNNDYFLYLLFFGVYIIYKLSNSDINNDEITIKQTNQNNQNIIDNNKICPKCGSPLYRRYTSDGIELFCRKTKKCGYIKKIR